MYVDLNKHLKDQEEIEGKIVQLTYQINNINEKLDSALQRKNTYFFVLLLVTLTASLVILAHISNYDSEFLEGGHFITQSLRGDAINTWLAWDLPETERVFHIHIKNQAQVSKQKLSMIEESIMSEKIIEINDLVTHKGPAKDSSKFYTGWKGVINEIDATELKYKLPIILHTHESMNNDGDILVLLTNEKNSEGYSGYTRSIIDENQKQILKSHITIYEADKLDGDKLADIMRHEMGHALGLLHSTDPDDIMYHKIKTTNQHISECDLDALESLYKGKKMSEFECKK